MLRVYVLLAAAVVGGLAWDFTESERYQTWVADLKPGFTVKMNEIDGRRCYCKVPVESSSSFSFNPIGVLSSSSVKSSSFEFHFLTKPPTARNNT
ncbi:uncharacterized protein LOC123519094 isoform X2 [Portunus trituberculatus]|uniref:uncharacterized protein LOC123519094 isoform X2 n=1 Tax=Portunus trituberculatus TaxID=210409 RepID=UPI001E1CBE79|nr:uncharacterized protein LOC123519094 isoform X2 [Portunus trituberculatus]